LYTGDVVLLELTRPLTLSETVGVACLTNNSQIDSNKQTRATTGWGSDVKDDVNSQQYVKYLPVPTTPIGECNSSAHYNGVLHEDAICAGEINTDKTTCYVNIQIPQKFESILHILILFF
jgi:hypothetical protein